MDLILSPPSSPPSPSPDWKVRAERFLSTIQPSVETLSLFDEV